MIINPYVYSNLILTPIGIDPLQTPVSLTLSSSNMVYTKTAGSNGLWHCASATPRKNSGKRVFEIELLSNGYHAIGVVPSSSSSIQATSSPEQDVLTLGGCAVWISTRMYIGTGNYINRGVGANTSGSVLRMYVNLDTGDVWVAINGVLVSGDPLTGVSPSYTISTLGEFEPRVGCYQDGSSARLRMVSSEMSNDPIPNGWIAWADDAVFTDKSILVGGVAGNGFMISSDSGDSWDHTSVNATYLPQGIDGVFLAGDRLYAKTSSGTDRVFTSLDGRTWAVCTGVETGPLSSACKTGDRYVLSFVNSLRISTDGINFYEELTQVGSNYGCASIGDVCVVSSTISNYKLSTNGGQTWTTLVAGTSAAYAVASASKFILVSGNICRLSSTGLNGSWSSSTITGMGSCDGITTDGGNTFVAIDTSGKIFYSLNNGSTWSPSTDIGIAGYTTGSVGDKAGAIVYTGDGWLASLYSSVGGIVKLFKSTLPHGPFNEIYSWTNSSAIEGMVKMPDKFTQYNVWSNSYKSTRAALSTDGSSLNSSGSTGLWANAVSVLPVTGKCYFSAKIVSSATGEPAGFGVVDSGSISNLVDPNNYVGQTNSVALWRKTGNVYSNDVVVESDSIFSSEEDLEICFNSVNRYVWIRPSGGAWIGGGNPVDDTLPTAVLSGSGSAFICASISSSDTGSVTIHRYTTEISGIAPDGYTKGLWMDVAYNDPYASQVFALLPFNTAITEETSGNSTWSSSAGTLDSASPVLSGSYALAPLHVESNETITIGSNDFTIEGWIRPTNSSSTYQTIFYVPGYAIYYKNGKLHWYEGGIRCESETLTVGTAYSFMVSRISGVVRLFINGKKSSADYSGSASIGTSRVYIGRNSAGGEISNCDVDELRITIGVARETSNYAPRVSPFP